LPNSPRAAAYAVLLALGAFLVAAAFELGATWPRDYIETDEDRLAEMTAEDKRAAWMAFEQLLTLAARAATSSSSWSTTPGARVMPLAWPIISAATVRASPLSRTLGDPPVVKGSA
jgi:hypothetical protein